MHEYGITLADDDEKEIAVKRNQKTGQEPESEKQGEDSNPTSQEVLGEEGFVADLVSNAKRLEELKRQQTQQT